MLIKFAVKFFKAFIAFVLTFLLSVLSFNLFYVKEKSQMLQIANEFHNSIVNNDKKLINNLLTDDFIEFGERRFVQTPEAIYKSDIVNSDYSKVDFTIEIKYSFPLNLLSGDSMSISFVRKLIINCKDCKTPASVSYFVTYTFEKTTDGLKIKKIERKL